MEATDIIKKIVAKMLAITGEKAASRLNIRDMHDIKDPLLKHKWQRLQRVYMGRSLEHLSSVIAVLATMELEDEGPGSPTPPKAHL